MARILILDPQSNALDLAMRWQMQGHSVLWYDRRRDDGLPRLAGTGIIEKIKDFNEIPKKWMAWADMIYLPDNVHFLDFLDPYFKQGYPIFGCNKMAAKLELDREAGQKAMKDAGMPIIPSKTFHDYDSAIAYVKKEGRAMVSKPSGDASKALSYVAKTAADLVFMLDLWKTNLQYRKDAAKYGFILQDKIDGIEMAVGGYFSNGAWCDYFFENFEYKKLMVGDHGVNTGEMGTCVHATKKSKLSEQVLLPMTEQLTKLNYVGFIDTNCMIDQSGTPWPMEFTMRDGWPCRHNITSFIEGDHAEWMLDLVHGYDSMKVIKDAISISVVIALPDFPYSKITNKELCGIPIYHATDMDHIHLSEAMMSDNVPTQIGDKVVYMPGLVTSGDYTMVVTGTGDTIAAARRSAYAAVKKVHIPNSPFYRTDIGAGRLTKQLELLHKLGYAKGVEL